MKLAARYWKLVISQAWKSAWGQSEIRSSLIALIVAVLGGGLLFGLAHLVSLPQSIANLLTDVFDDVRLQIFYFGITLVLASFTFAYFLIYIPARLYKDLGGFLKSPLTLQSASGKPKELGNVEMWVSIRVDNTTKISANDCKLRLVDAISKETGKSVLRTAEYLLWSAREGGNEVRNNPKSIDASYRICDVAKTDSKLDRAKFELWFGHPQHVRQGNYILEIEASGNWKGFSFIETYKFELIYSGGYDLILKDV